MGSEIALYIVILLLVILIFAMVFFILSQKEETRARNLEILSLINEFGRDLGDKFSDKFYYLNKSLGDELGKNDNNLNLNLKSIDTTFKNVLEKVAKIENSSLINTQIRDEINHLNKILSNQKLRGNFGEYQLEKILEFLYGENKNFYEFQKTLSNSKIIDCAVYLKNRKILPIDSKFPLANYERIINSTDEKEVKFYQNELFKDMKKHILDISSKYIITGETSEFGVLFIPSEAVFVYVCSHLPQTIEFATKNSVFIASPTTISSLIFVIRLFTRDEIMARNLTEIRNEMLILSQKFATHSKHLALFENHAAKMHDQIKILNKNAKDITESFEKFTKL